MALLMNNGLLRRAAREPASQRRERPSRSAATLAAFLLVLCAVSALLRPASALHFYLEGNEQKCFIEELPKDTNVVGACVPGTRRVGPRP